MRNRRRRYNFNPLKKMIQEFLLLVLFVATLLFVVAYSLVKDARYEKDGGHGNMYQNIQVLKGE